jgi:phosphoglycerate-specific signal transduction histidine kinase
MSTPSFTDKFIIVLNEPAGQAFDELKEKASKLFEENKPALEQSKQKAEKLLQEAKSKVSETFDDLKNKLSNINTKQLEVENLEKQLAKSKRDLREAINQKKEDVNAAINQYKLNQDETKVVEDVEDVEKNIIAGQIVKEVLTGGTRNLSNNDLSYRPKYMKYKAKYLALLNQK